MEREREIAKLVNVLGKTARMAQQAELTGGNGTAAAHCVEQYNRVLARIAEIDPDVGTIFKPLAEGSSLTVVAIACRQLVAYFEDETGGRRHWGRAFGIGVDKGTFEEFWCQSAHEIEDLGQFIRESIDAWARRQKERHGAARERAGAEEK